MRWRVAARNARSQTAPYNRVMAGQRKSGPERFMARLRQRDATARVVELPGSTRTAPEAAAAIGCEVRQIAKSIVFRDARRERALLVVACGDRRVSIARLEDLAGTRVRTADADFVRAHTGYAIGGVPPFGHAGPVATWLDDALFALPSVWAAAGGPYHVFETTAGRLLEYSGGTRADIAA